MTFLQGGPKFEVTPLAHRTVFSCMIMMWAFRFGYSFLYAKYKY